MLHYLVAHPDIPADIREALVLDFEKYPQPAIYLKKRYASRQDPSWLTLKRQSVHKDLDLSNIIEVFIEHNMCSDRLFYKYCVPVSRTVIIPIHHWLGRGLLIMVYVQLYLGIQLINLETFVRHCFYGWVAILALLFIYKEVRLQLRRWRESCIQPKESNGDKSSKKGSSGSPATGSGRRSFREALSRSRSLKAEEKAALYTEKYFKDRRHHEAQLFSIHNFVGTKQSARRTLSGNRKLSAPQSSNANTDTVIAVAPSLNVSSSTTDADAQNNSRNDTAEPLQTTSLAVIEEA